MSIHNDNGDYKMLIDIDYLKSKDACDAGVLWFKENIKKPINHVDLIIILLRTSSTDSLVKIKWCSWLLTSLFNKKQNIKYAIFSAASAYAYYAACATYSAYAYYAACGTGDFYARLAAKKEAFIKIINYGLELLESDQ